MTTPESAASSIRKSCCRPTRPRTFKTVERFGTAWSKLKKACNSQLARELEVALPIELSREEQVRLVRAYCSSQFVSRGMCADFNIHDTGSGNPHAHILLTMRPMDAQGKWLPKSKKEYVLDENGEKIRLPSGRYKTRKVDLVDWNNRENAEVWRKAWADLANEFWNGITARSASTTAAMSGRGSIKSPPFISAWQRHRWRKRNRYRARRTEPQYQSDKSSAPRHQGADRQAERMAA